jgi:dihydroorotase
MPNLQPPVTTTALALAIPPAHRRCLARCLAQRRAGAGFKPLMTLYLTDNPPVDEIARARCCRRRGAQALPGRRHHQQRRRRHRHPQDLQGAGGHAARAGLLLLVHGEVTDPAVDLFDREAVFIDRVMRPLRRDFPELKVVFEHITTREAAQYVAEAGPHTAATITAHHLLYNRNAIFMGGLRPHYYCLPVLKREGTARRWWRRPPRAAPRFFLGTDSAPHAAVLKEHAASAAPAASPRCRRWSCTPRPSTPPARWTSWKASPASTARLLRPAAQHRHA